MYFLLKFTLKTGLELGAQSIRSSLQRILIQAANLSVDVPGAEREGDVGLTLIFDRSNQVYGWSLLFPLGEFDNPRIARRSGLPPTFLIGKVINQDGMDCIRKKATTLKDLSFTLKTDSSN